MVSKRLSLWLEENTFPNFAIFIGIRKGYTITNQSFQLHGEKLSYYVNINEYINHYEFGSFKVNLSHANKSSM